MPCLALFCLFVSVCCPLTERVRLQIQFSWLWKLANVTQNPYSYVWSNDTNAPELINGPSKKTMYVTALYFTMTCMTSVSIRGGSGN